MGTKYVYDFEEGNKDLKDMLGGKGANLAEMSSMGSPSRWLYDHHGNVRQLPRGL